jgi:hypothetical protein
MGGVVVGELGRVFSGINDTVSGDVAKGVL